MKTERKIFISSLIILLLIIAFLFANLSFLQEGIGAIYERCISSFGWFFLIVDICCLIFSLWLMFGRYKNVRLGGDDCKPEFSTWSWAGMMFTTSCGAWLVVYGFLEPMYCVSQDAVVVGDSLTKAYEYGQMYAHFHWGPNAWCIYVPMTVAIGYALYNRRAKGARVSDGIEIITHNKSGKTVAFLADIFAICGAVIAPVISIGTGMPLLVALVQNIFGISNDNNTFIQIAVLATWIIIFGTSVFLGLQRGIKRLSNINVILAFVFMLVFAGLVGVVHVLYSEVNTIGLLADNFIRINTYTDAYGSGGFVRGWTFSYWACYFVYMPLMGVFTAKISKGRTLKEISFGLLVLCSLGCWFAMGTFGNYAIDQQISGNVDVLGYLANGDEAGAIIALINTTPAPKVFMCILLVILFIFLATTMDSSAFSAAEMTVEKNTEEKLAPRWLRILWAVIAAVIAFIVLQVGGAKAVRSLCYLSGLPLAIIAILVLISLCKMLKEK